MLICNLKWLPRTIQSKPILIYIFWYIMSHVLRWPFLSTENTDHFFLFRTTWFYALFRMYICTKMNTFSSRIHRLMSIKYIDNILSLRLNYVTFLHSKIMIKYQWHQMLLHYVHEISSCWVFCRRKVRWGDLLLFNFFCLLIR